MKRFYNEVTPTISYVDTQLDFSSNAQMLKIITVNADCEISFDGKTLHGKIKPGDGQVDFENIAASKIWVRGVGSTVRIFAW